MRAEVLAAHDSAVVAALDWFEHHGALTRRGTNGVDQVDTQGLVAAVFRQHTSRSADPQLHTHAVIVTKVPDPTGKWLSLDARFLKQQQFSISWVYAGALRSELSARLGVSWGPVEKGHADIDGVAEDLRTLFSQRDAQIEAKLDELISAWVDEHDGAEPDPWTISRLERAAVLASRPGKQGVVEADVLRAEWTSRAREAGFEVLSLPDGQGRLPQPPETHRRGRRGAHRRRWPGRGGAAQERVLPHRSAHAVALRRARGASGEAGSHGRDTPWRRVRVHGTRGWPSSSHLLHKRIFRPAVLAAGLPEALRTHDLRHTCTALLIELGAHPKVIQEWLGHRSIMVTMDVYGHLFPSLSQALAERLDEVFQRASTCPGASPGADVRNLRAGGDEPNES